MSAPTPAMRLSVVAVHGAGLDTTASESFRKGMIKVGARVQELLQESHPSIGLDIQVWSPEHAASAGDWHAGCVVAVVDATGQDERTAWQLGKLVGARMPVIMIGNAASIASAPPLGSGDPIVYESMDALFERRSELESALLREIPTSRIQEELVYRFWFPRGTSTVWVVCPRDHNPTEYADRANPNYTYLDTLGDQDALLELMVFLSRHYPSAMIRHVDSEGLPEVNTGDNLVVLGGPGSDADISNRMCREMMSAVGTAVSYADDCQSMVVSTGDGSVELSAMFEKGRIRKDVGYFARFPNPANQACAVVLVNGIHTTGVLGAARAFGERREALRNFGAVLGSGVNAEAFETYFDVDVLNGAVRVPNIEGANVLPLATAGQRGGLKPVWTKRAAADIHAEHAVKLLFITGDRGGSQVQQIQSPKEFHGIQDALRRGRTRNGISLAEPILAATPERLANAYLQRAQIIHFVGHGNDRSLSIISDLGLIARETPLDASRLVTFLKTMQDPVLLCVLNTCESADLAKGVVEAGGALYCVGWPSKVNDSEAVAFSEAFYGALADGRSMTDAMSVAAVAIHAREDPVLYMKDGADGGPLITPEEGE